MTKYKGQTLPGNHEAIVSQDVFDRCLDMRRRHHKGSWTFTPRHRTYLLGGLLRCADCGTKLWSQNLYGRDYYREESGLRGLPCLRPKSLIKADVVESQIEQIITSLRLPESWRETVTYYLGLSEERERVGQERSRLEERLRRLQRLYLDGLDESEYRRERAAVDAALQALGGVLDEEVFIQGDNVEGLIEAWRYATREERRDILQMMLQAVYVDTANGQVVALDVKPSFKPLFRAWLETAEPKGLAFGSDRLCMATPRGFEPPISTVTGWHV